MQQAKQNKSNKQKTGTYETTRENWSSEWADVCNQCKGKTHKEILGMLREWGCTEQLTFTQGEGNLEEKVDQVHSNAAALSKRLHGKLERMKRHI